METNTALITTERVLVKFLIGFRPPGYPHYAPGEVAGFPAKVAAHLVTARVKEGLDGKDIGHAAEYVDADHQPSRTPVAVRIPVRSLRRDEVAV